MKSQSTNSSWAILTFSFISWPLVYWVLYTQRAWWIFELPWCLSIKGWIGSLTHGSFTTTLLFSRSSPNYWGVQRTTEEIRQSFYWPGWRKEVSIFESDCGGCFLREVIDLKDTVLHKNRALRVNQTLCMDLVGPLPFVTIKINKCSLYLTISVVSWCLYPSSTRVQNQCVPASTPGG